MSKAQNSFLNKLAEMAGPLPPAPSPGMAIFSAWENEPAGTKRIAELAFGQDNPQSNVQDAIKKARYWFRYNWMVRAIILLRYAFFNYGMTVKAFDPADKPKVDKWLKEKRVRDNVTRYARDAWLEFLTVDSAVGLWRKTGKPLVFSAEDCDFKDDFGIEELTIQTHITGEKARKMKGLSQAEINQLVNSGGRLVLRHTNQTFFFDVVRRTRLGEGFAWPGLAVVFTTLAQNESMEVSDNIWAQMGRVCYEQHLMGHEIKGGTHAGSKAHFCTEKKAKKVEDGLKGKTGHVRIATNFDHLIKYHRPDPASFDPKKYDATVKRLSLWSMPLGQMVLEKSLNPYLMDLLRMQAGMDREYMRPHLATVLQQSLDCPVELTLSWSNRCFKDSRLAADLMKFGLKWGIVSQQSAQEEAGYDPELEYSRKAEEATKPKVQTHPLVDADHGEQKKNGRDRGTADGQGKR